MNTQRPLRIATRGSQLALWQANYVAAMLQKRGLQTELSIIKTTGDRVQDRFLHEIGGKGLFVRELEEALKSGSADLAVHSLKDLPARVAEGFTLAAILPRHIPHDALIFNPKVLEKLNLPTSEILSRSQVEKLGPLTIATASLRRQSLLKALKNPIELVAIRGNVDTRIRKLNEGDWDGLILAGASLERLSLMHLPHKLLDTDWFVPCAAQGALAIETLADSPFRLQISALSDPRTYACATLERRVLEALGGDCTMPFGAFFRFDPYSKQTLGQALVLDYDGGEARCSLHFSAVPERLDIEDTCSRVLKSLETAKVGNILERLKVKAPSLGHLA